MREFRLGEAFDLILFPFRSFQSLTDNIQRLECLRCCRAHLSAKGRVIITMFDPKPEILEHFDTIRKFDGSIDDAGLVIERHTIGKSHDRERQTISSSYLFRVIRDGGIVQTVEEPLLLGYLHADQAVSLFESAGFKVLNVYKDWDCSGLDDEKKELIFVLAHARGSLLRNPGKVVRASEVRTGRSDRSGPGGFPVQLETGRRVAWLEEFRGSVLQERFGRGDQYSRDASGGFHHYHAVPKGCWDLQVDQEILDLA
jgi:hypothetical protein